jgi:primosomal protein N''
MKKVLIAIIVLSMTGAAFAQSEKYTKAMQTNIAAIDSAKSPDDMLALSAAFERVGDAEKTQWLPYYYAAFTQTLYAFFKNDVANNDAYADKAEQLIAKAEALEKNNSEISCIKSMIASLHMMVNPQQRWQTYGAAIQSEIDKAKTQDASNPRPYYLQGQNLRYTPEQFGGGCATAKPLLEEAVKKFEAFKPATGLHPNWGMARTKQLIDGCK